MSGNLDGALGNITFVEHEKMEKINRVLDAARAWRKVWPTSNPVAAQANELMAAINALDAPAERWVVWPGGIHVRDRETGEVLTAEQCAAALNAAERAK